MITTIVEAERLFVDVAEQVKGLKGNVGAVQTPLQQRPEVLQSICAHDAGTYASA